MSKEAVEKKSLDFMIRIVGHDSYLAGHHLKILDLTCRSQRDGSTNLNPTIDITARYLDKKGRRHSPDTCDMKTSHSDFPDRIKKAGNVHYIRCTFDEETTGLQLLKSGIWQNRLLLQTPWRGEATERFRSVLMDEVQDYWGACCAVETFCQDEFGNIHADYNQPGDPAALLLILTRGELPNVGKIAVLPFGLMQEDRPFGENNYKASATGSNEIVWVSTGELFPIAADQLRKSETLLDIGCGIRPQELTIPQVHICCEPYEEYVHVLLEKSKNSSDRKMVVIQSDWSQAVEMFPEKSVDCVFLMNIIEHLSKSESMRLLKATEKIAKSQIAVFTPLGFMEQCHPDGKDAWGFDGGAWQEHKSGWTPDDFDNSWRIFACRDFHINNNLGNTLEKPFGAFWAIKNFAPTDEGYSLEVDVPPQPGAYGPANESRPLFSVVVPAYNQAQFLPAALDSILAQTFSDWEAVVVNDGSTDRTKEVMESYARLDGRVRLFHKKNGGAGSALNEGVRQARGQWICWLSSDDLFEHDKLEVHASAIRENPGIMFFYTHFYYLEDATGAKTAPDLWLPVPEPEFQVSRFLLRNYVHGNSIAIHRSVFEEVGLFDETLRQGQDFDLWLRISAKYRSRFIDRRTCVTRWHEGQTTNRFPEACFYDSARACIRFLDGHKFAEIFPLLDLNRPQDAFKAVSETLGLTTNTDSFMYSAGYMTALIERFDEWLSNECDPGVKAMIVPLLKGFLDEVARSNLPCEIKAAYKNLRSSGPGPYKYVRHDFDSEALNATSQMEMRGEAKKAGALRQYVSQFLKRAGENSCSKPAFINVCLVTHAFPPHSVGGSELYTLWLAMNLRKHGFNPIVFHPVREPEKPDYLLEGTKMEGVEVITINRHAELPYQRFGDPLLDAAFSKVLVEKNISMVHFQHLCGALSPSMVEAADQLGLPVVLTLHDAWIACDRGHAIDYLSRPCIGPESVDKCARCIVKGGETGLDHFASCLKLRNSYLEQVLGRCSIITAPTNYLRDLVRKADWCKSKKIEVVPHGLQYFTTSRPDGHDGGRKTIRLGALGNFVLFGDGIDLKGARVLLDAFRQLRPGEFELHIYGKISDALLSEFQSCPGVEYHGPYLPEQREAVFSNLDCIVLPSLIESYSMVAREAMLANLPVIASRTGGIPEVIHHEHNGLLFRPGSSAELAAQINRLLSEPQLLERLRAGIRPPLSMEEDAAQWAERYRKLTGDTFPPATSKIISVVIATYDRPGWLRRCLEGFCNQTLPRKNFEVIVVDDCSTEPVEGLADEFKDRLRLQYIRHSENKGPGAARNTGLDASNGEIVLFFDDDDRPTSRLLAEHMRFHLEHPEEIAAVLGYTGWDPELELTPVMYHVTQVGKQYFSYPDLKPDVPLEWHCFWCGRSSVKRNLLARVGGFDAEFSLAALDDTELAYRLRKEGLKVYYNPRAISYGMRSLDMEDFCKRWERQGKGVALMVHKHPEPFLHEHFNIAGAAERLERLSPALPQFKEMISQLEKMPLARLRSFSIDWGEEKISADTALHRLYGFVFETHRLQGYLQGNNERKTGTSPSKNILVIAPELPAFDRSSGSFRLFQIVKIMRNAGHRVTFIARAGAGELDPAPYIGKLQEMGVRVFPADPDKIRQKWGVQINSPRIDLRSILQEGRYDTAYLYFYELADQYIDELRRFCPETRIIVDSVDLHFLREERLAALNSDSQASARSSVTKKTELDVYRRADTVVAVTDVDRQALLHEAPEIEVEVIPNIHPMSEGESASFKKRRDFLFVGGFLHHPNVDAMRFFCEQAWPKISSEIPEARLFIVGSNPPREILNLPSDRITVTGYVPETTPYLRKCRVSIAPLRYGAGMKGKVGEALAAGLPVVATSIAAEGMGLEPGSHILIADDASEFADAAIRLYRDEDLWNRLSKKGKAHIRGLYSPEAAGKKLVQILSRGRRAGKPSVSGKVMISIVIPTFNNLHLTKQCIEAIHRTAYPGSYEIIVVDNASTDGTRDFLLGEQSGGRLTAILNDSNLLFAKACNLGAQRSRAKYVLFLNNDTIPQPGWLDSLVQTAENDHQIGALGSKLLYPDGTIQHCGVVAGLRDEEPYPYHIYLCQPSDAPHVNKFREFQMLTGACLMVRCELFDKLGGFDEGYKNGHEDLDLCLRIRQAVKKVVYCPQSVLIHLEARTKRLFGLDNFHYQKGIENEEGKGRRRFLDRWRNILQIDDQKYLAEDGLIPRAKAHPVQMPGESGGKSGVKRILFTMYGWEEEGGGTILPRQIARALAAQGCDLSVVFTGAGQRPEKGAYYVEESNDSGVRLFGIYNRPALFYDLENPLREADDPNMAAIVSRLIAELQPDIVHYHSLLNFSMGVPEAVSRAGVPSVYTSHNYWPICPRMYLFDQTLNLCSGPSDDGVKCAVCIGKPDKAADYALRFERGRRMLGRHIGRHLAVSNRVREIFIQNGHSPASIYVLQQRPETVDRIWQRAGANRMPRSSFGQPIRVGFIGSLLPQKGVHVLLAAGQVFEPGQIEIHVFGSGPAPYVKGLQKIDKKGVVWFHGRYELSQLPDLLARLDMMVIPSVWEDCAPLVVAESLAARVPVIGSRIGGIPDFIREGINGFLFEAGNPAALSAILRKLAANPSILRQLQQNSHPGKSFDGYLTELLDHYKEVTTSAGKKPASLGSGTGGEKALRVVWEGSQFVYHSLALINRELCIKLIDAGHDVTVIPYEKDQFGPEVSPRFQKLASSVGRNLPCIPDVHVRHQWPPNFTPPPAGHWVMIQPWEFGRLPADWVRPMNELVDEIWVPSRHVLKSYVASGVSTERVKVIPNGVDTELFHPGAVPYRLSTGKKFKFLFVGGTIWRKGIDLLLKAYCESFRREDDVALVIKDMGQDSFYKGQGVGDAIRRIQNDPTAPELVYLTDMIEERDMPRLFTACDCLVHPYRGEGFGLPVLEAMACGVPVIVTEGGATDDFCLPEFSYQVASARREVNVDGMLLAGGAGYVLEPDIASIREMLRAVYDNPAEARQKAAGALEHVRSRYDWDNIAAMVEERSRAIAEKPVRRLVG